MITIEEQQADGTLLYGWKSELPLTPVAPSYTHYLTEKKIFSTEECEEWFAYLLEQEPILLNKFRTGIADGGTGLGATAITARYQHFNLLNFDFHLIPKLKTHILKGIEDILHISGNTNWQETLYANSWFNVLRQGEEMQAHCHGYHKYIFYGFHVNITANETFTTYYHPVKFQDEAFYVPNKPGYLTLFPDFIPHSVTVNKYNVPRISIAGDIFSSAWLDEEPRPGFKANIDNKNLVKIGTCNRKKKENE